MKKIILLLITVLCVQFSFAQDKKNLPEPLPNTYIHDYIDVLTPQQELDINRKIKTIDTGTTVQLVVLLVDKIPDGVATVDYAMNVGNAWGVGNGENGLVLVIAAERKMASAPAERLEGNYPDITSNHILQELKPFLKNKDYNGAILKYIDEIKKVIDPVEQKANTEYYKERKARENELDPFTLLLIILGVAGVIGLIAWYLWKKTVSEKTETPPNVYPTYPTSPTRRKTTTVVPTPTWIEPDEPVRNRRDDDDDSDKDDKETFGNLGGSGGFSGAGSEETW